MASNVHRSHYQRATRATHEHKHSGTKFIWCFQLSAVTNVEHCVNYYIISVVSTYLVKKQLSKIKWLYTAMRSMTRRTQVSKKNKMSIAINQKYYSHKVLKQWITAMLLTYLTTSCGHLFINCINNHMTNIDSWAIMLHEPILHTFIKIHKIITSCQNHQWRCNVIWALYTINFNVSASVVNEWNNIPAKYLASLQWRVSFRW